jgi:GNAT superfamily N-acetyltransferase
MSNILHDFSTPSLISANEENFFANLSSIRKWPRAELHEEKEIMWSMTDIPISFFNCIWRAQLAPERIEAVIESIIAQAKSRNVPLLWWTGPTTRPADLGSYLERHGFVCAGQEPGMAVDLANLSVNPTMPAGLTIQQVRDNEALKQAVQILSIVFEIPDFLAKEYYDYMRHICPDPFKLYLGRLNGKPVATSALVLAAGVAGIYGVATIPEARRQGIGARMSDYPLLEARALGYRVGILQSSEMGVGVYQSLGFQEYCNIGLYIWSPENT